MAPHNDPAAMHEALTVVQRFLELFAQAKYKEAAELAAESPRGLLRTHETVAKFQSVRVQAGQTPPLLQYFGTLLTRGKLNAYESRELSRLVVNLNEKNILENWLAKDMLQCSEELGDLVKIKRNLFENWLAQDKLECSEELGDLVMTVDNDLALKIYLKARATPKDVAAFAERRQFDKILTYSKQVGYTPDYRFLLQTILRTHPQEAVKFALMMSQTEDGCLVDYYTITDLFLQRNMIKEATAFLKDVLKPNLPQHAFLQTKVLEINLVTDPNAADAILANGMFSHYDRPRIAQLCEKAGLYLRALQNYTELRDIRRVIVNAHAMEPQALVEFLGTLPRGWALECMKELLLVDPKGNVHVVVLAAKEYSDKLGVGSCVKLFEQFKSFEGLYLFLGSYLSSSEDPDIHFKYIKAAAKTGQIKEVERVTRESKFYDAEKTKDFLMETKLPDPRPLINVCDRCFRFVPVLTHYLYTNNMLWYIEDYVQNVNPVNAPLVVGQLLDDGCPEDFIKGLIMSVCCLIPVEPLVDECEKRNRLRLLTQFLEKLVRGGSRDEYVHNAHGKIIIDSNKDKDPERFLSTNPFYDSRVVGKYCEKRNPKLAVVAYDRGQCDDELINITNKYSLFKQQARYVMKRMDADLWHRVLRPENEYRRRLIEQVVFTASPECTIPAQVSAAVNAFMTADLPIELLEKIVLQKSAFSGDCNLQNLLILKAIKEDPSRVMGYVKRLHNFDGPAVGKEAFEAQLYEEAFAIFSKFNLNVMAVKVLLDNIQSIERAKEFACRVNKHAVWSMVAEAQLRKGLVSEAIESFIRIEDATDFLDVIRAAEEANVYHDLVKYLLMARRKASEPIVDGELIFAYAKLHRLCDIEKFILVPNVADLLKVGDRLYGEKLYEAAKIIYAFISNWAQLAVTLAKLKQFQCAVDAAYKANSCETWKEVCFACVDAEEFCLAHKCGLKVIIQDACVDGVEQVSEYYQNRGCFDELISLMECGHRLERADRRIFSELGVLYARYRPEKLMEHIKLCPFQCCCPRSAKLLRACHEQQHWKELTYLYIRYCEFYNAATTIMDHSPDTWDHTEFKDVVAKVANETHCKDVAAKVKHDELCYRAVQFYLQEHPDLINDLLDVLALRLEYTRVVDMVRKAGQLHLVKRYLVSVQSKDVSAVNEALNELYVEEEDYVRLRESVDKYGNFDHIGLAQKLEKHELLEMRRIAAEVYRKAGRWKQSVALSKKDHMYKDCMETCSQSGDRELSEDLLAYFIEQGKKECFAACLFICYDLIRADVALELAWMNNMVDFAFPYLIQFIREYTSKVDELEKDRDHGME